MNLVHRSEWLLRKPLGAGQRGSELTQDVRYRCGGWDDEIKGAAASLFRVGREQEDLHCE